MLEFVLLIDELPTEFDDKDDERCGELVVLARTIRDITRLAPDERTTWHSVMAALGVRMSEAQLIALSSAFTASKNPGMLLAATIVGVAMASGILKQNEG